MRWRVMSAEASVIVEASSEGEAHEKGLALLGEEGDACLLLWVEPVEDGAEPPPRRPTGPSTRPQ
ncbi:MAG TPA: hypothetical protein VFK80_07725 [Limnochordia bacterium]|nr:hypothetical protein [Limnochordia bacterium]